MMSSETTPGKLQPKDLIALLGDAAARQIMKAFGGRRIPGLTEERVSREARNAEIIDFYFKSKSDLEATAAHYNLSERQVKRIVNGR